MAAVTKNNWHKSVERKISQKSPEYMLIYSSLNLKSLQLKFELILLYNKAAMDN
jgi:hypothetical protein